MGIISERVLQNCDAELVCQSLGIKLGKRNHDKIQMLCPYPDHADKKFGNCQLNTSNKLFYCFACGRGGSVIDIVMMHHGWSTAEKSKSYEAMKEICSICGIDESIVSDDKKFKKKKLPPALTEEDMSFLGIYNESIVDNETGEVVSYSPVTKMRLEDEDAYCYLVINRAKELVRQEREKMNNELSYIIRGNYRIRLDPTLEQFKNKIKRARVIEDTFLDYLIGRKKSGKEIKKH